MKIDFVDVTNDALTTVWGRLLGAWASIISGSFLAYFILGILNWNFAFPDSTGFILFLFFTPIFAIFGGIASGAVGIFCALCMLVTVFHGLYFIVNDRGLPELKIIGGLSFLSFAWIFIEFDLYLGGSIACLLVGGFLYRAQQELREELA